MQMLTGNDNHAETLWLSQLELGRAARVLGIDTDATTRRRLMEMGITRGEALHIEKVAPLGDPMELVVRGYHLSLRRAENACIRVEREL
jgi:ferrous iron transport protein A